jgi:hypothetical protein
MLEEIESRRVQRFKAWTEAKLRGVRCPEHHQQPRVSFSGSTLRDVTISLSGCCAKLMKLANQAVAEYPATR